MLLEAVAGHAPDSDVAVEAADYWKVAVAVHDVTAGVGQDTILVSE